MKYVLGVAVIIVIIVLTSVGYSDLKTSNEVIDLDYIRELRQIDSCEEAVEELDLIMTYKRDSKYYNDYRDELDKTVQSFLPNGQRCIGV